MLEKYTVQKGENRMTKYKNAIVVLVCVVAGIIFGQLMSHTVFFTSRVMGDSMNPTYTNGEMVGVNRLDTPERGDIIVVDEGDKYVIKRLVGMPGDTLEIKEGNVYLNGSLYEENYTLEPGLEYDAGIAEVPITLKEGEYFMLGDNRGISRDSRQVGVILESQIVGVVVN